MSVHTFAGDTDDKSGVPSGDGIAAGTSGVGEPNTVKSVEESKLKPIYKLIVKSCDSTIRFAGNGLSDIYNFSVRTLKKDNVNDGHKGYIEEKNKEKGKWEKELKETVTAGEKNEFKEEEMVKRFDNLTNIISSYKSLIDEVYYKAYGTLKDDFANDFEHHYKALKGSILSYLLNVLNSSMDLIGKTIIEDKIKDIKKAIEMRVFKVNDLLTKITSMGWSKCDYDAHFEGIVKEVDGATNEFNKAIDIVIAEMGESGIIIDGKLVSSIKSFFSTISNIFSAALTDTSNETTPNIYYIIIAVLMILILFIIFIAIKCITRFKHD